MAQPNRIILLGETQPNQLLNVITELQKGKLPLCPGGLGAKQPNSCEPGHHKEAHSP